ncbi:MAG: site-2 protease family protein [Acidimicrobiales bacterium]
MTGHGEVTIGGIAVRVDPSFLLLSVFIGFAGGRGIEGAAVWVVVVGLSILIHELGHAFTFRAFGVSSSVLLYAMGGLTVPERGPRLRPGQDILVSLAGPGIGLVLGAVVFLVAPPGDFPDGSLARLASFYLLYVNVAWGLLNLLPILPLDGGNVLAAILRKTSGERGVRFVRIISLVVAAALGAAALAYEQPFLAILAFYFGYINLTALRGEGAAPRPSPAEEVLVKGAAALDAGNFDGAEWGARNLLDRPDASPPMKAAASELLAWTGLARGSLATATAGLAAAPADAAAGALVHACVALVRDGADVAAPALAAGLCAGSAIIPAGIVAKVVLDAGVLDDVVERLGIAPDRSGAAAGLGRLQEVLHQAGRFDEAARVGERAFALTASGVIAFNTACSVARAGREGQALPWLRAAIGAGWHDLAQLERDPDLAAVRSGPGFAEVRSLVAADADGGTGVAGAG